MRNGNQKPVALDQIALLKDELLKDAIERFAQKAVVEVMQRILHVDNAEDILCALTDSESNIVSYVDKDGRTHHCAGATTHGDQEVTGDLQVEGKVLVGDCQVVENVEGGMYYILDSDGRVLFEINSRGETNFKGIPGDVQSALDALEERIEALEGE